MSEDRTITLGGRDFSIAPLTLGQMRAAGPAFTRIGVDTPDGMAAQITVIAAAVRAGDRERYRSDGEAAQMLEDIAGVTFDELKAAVEKVGALMGLKRKTDPGEGEAPAAAPASTP